MCEIKKHLIKLSLYIKGVITNNYPNAYDVLMDFIKEKEKRIKADEELLSVLKKNSKYSFVELKNIRDNDYKKYLEIKNKE